MEYKLNGMNDYCYRWRISCNASKILKENLKLDNDYEPVENLFIW